MRRLAAAAAARLAATRALATSAAGDAGAVRPLADFLPRGGTEPSPSAPWSPAPVPVGAVDEAGGREASPRRRYAIETYGCQMNTADSETVAALLADAGWDRVAADAAPHAVLINTCTIRDGAEARVRARLAQIKGAARKGPAAAAPAVAVLGCVAQRAGRELTAGGGGLADVAAGPDGYRDLPRLLAAAVDGKQGGRGRAAAGAADAADPAPPLVSDALSLDETYAEVAPLRTAGAVTALVSVQRGCSNHCAFCVVPRVRGRERSRPVASVVADAAAAVEGGAREILLLGQNVNSYSAWPSEAARLAAAAAVREAGGKDAAAARHYAPGFASVYAPLRAGAATFADLLDAVASIDPEVRVRFTSPHPKDFHASVFAAMAAHPNIAPCLHMPAQSGSDAVLARMARGYSRAAYDALVAAARDALPGVAITTDIIVGFCGETEADHARTLDLIARHAFDGAFLYAYSARPGTPASRRLVDDVPPAVKSRRLGEAVATYRAALARASAVDAAASAHLVLVEGPARRQPPPDAARDAPRRLTGRTGRGRRVVFDDVSVAAGLAGDGAAAPRVRLAPGDYVAVRVTEPALGSLPGVAIARTSVAEYARVHGR